VKKLILIALVLSAAAGYIWVKLYSDDWLTQFNDERQASAEALRQQGQKFGQNSTQQGCFDEALKSVEDCRSPICMVDSGNFLRGCFETSSDTPNFCEGVPAYQSKITEDEKSWARYGCWDIDNKSDGCRLLKRQQQALCSDIQANIESEING
jgi:hypothetical protein